jgi:dTDP-4-amino-4,6-dideoxygalactose transaminase
MKIQFVDLYSQYLSIKTEIDSVVEDVIRQSAYIRGPYVNKFESEFASLFGVKYCVSCGNGTDSLYISIKSLGLVPGDEVITTAHSWISTSETITQAGGKVVFVDTDLDSFNINSKMIEERITSKTRGIIPVHLYGQSADMDSIMEIARKYNLWVIEDCAQSHLAEYKGSLTGTIGNVGSFSFYPGKNLGAYGDAGAIVTNDDGLARRFTCFARHGGVKKGEHEIEGVNSRLDGLQAAILGVKLPHLKKWTSARQRIAKIYTEELSGVGDIVTPVIMPTNNHVFHLYVIRTKKRDQLASHLAKNGIPTVVNYQTALPFLKAYEYLNHNPKDFPVAYKNQFEILSLPIYPEISDSQIKFIIDQIKRFF